MGFGSCIDIFMNAIPLFEKLGMSPPEKTEEYGILSDETIFKEEFSFYFKQGAAAERYVSDRELFDKLVAASLELNADTHLGML